LRLKEQEELARLDQSERTEQKSERKEYVPENETGRTDPACLWHKIMERS